MFPWGSFPFNKDMSLMMKNMKPEMIDQYVRDALGSFMNGNDINKFSTSILGAEQQEAASAGPVRASIFETHDFVFARLHIEEEWEKRIRIFHTSTQLIVENIPEQGSKQTFTLPAIVKKKGAAASVRDGILEIRLVRAWDTQMSEINVD